MASNRLLEPGLSTSPLVSLMLVLHLVTMTLSLWPQTGSSTCFEHFPSVVIDAGFTSNDNDPPLFVHSYPCDRTLLLYVGEMIIIGDDS